MAALYLLISWVFYREKLQGVIFFSAITDIFLEIACIIVASLLGKPLASLDCSSLSAVSSDSATSSWISSVGKNMGKLSYTYWLGASQTVCYETKAIWGLSIALCLLFFLSSVFGFAMWYRAKQEAKEGNAGKGGDEEFGN